LFGVFGQAVAAVAKAGVVVVVAYAGVEADALDDLAGVQPVGDGIGVQLVEKGHAHGEVGVGKQFDGFGFCAVCQERINVLLDGSLLQQRADPWRISPCLREKSQSQ